MKIPSASVLALGLIFLNACSSSKEETKKETIENVTPISVTLSSPMVNSQEGIMVSGQVEAIQTSQITTRMMGFINKIYVKVGDKVSSGQLLVSINNQDMQAKRAQTTAMLAEAEANLASAQKDMDRFTSLQTQGSATAKEMDNVTLQYNSAKSRVEAAKQMRNEVDAMISYSSLKAPFAGVITRKMANEGSMANPGMPILTLEQGGGFQVSASVPEIDINKISQGANAMVLVKATGTSLQGKIGEISQSSQGTGGQYAVKINLNPQDTKGLYSGMYVHVTIPVAKAQKVSGKHILVPQSSIIQKDQLTGIYVVNGKTAVLRWLRVGKVWGDQIEVLSGLGADNQFVLNPSDKLQNGSPISVNGK